MTTGWKDPGGKGRSPAQYKADQNQTKVLNHFSKMEKLLMVQDALQAVVEAGLQEASRMITAQSMKQVSTK